MTTTTIPRQITRIVPGVSVSDGDGVQLQRIIGTPYLRNLNPFLMLDEFRSTDSASANFPAHPHRGFQTVTYMLQGKAVHKDDCGNGGELVAGSVQWMNAGRGIVHSEAIEPVDGLMWGFQLWVNLPAAEKMSEPAYQEYGPDEIPLVNLADGITAKIIAGRTVDGQEGAVRNIATQPLFMDVRIESMDGVFTQSIPTDHAAFLYVYDGLALVAGKTVPRGNLVNLSAGNVIEVGGPAKFLLIAGAPIDEPIVQRGPFVMNTMEEIYQAYADFGAR